MPPEIDLSPFARLAEFHEQVGRAVGEVLAAQTAGIAEAFRSFGERMARVGDASATFPEDREDA